MTEITKVHFTVNAESVVRLCRQAWLYEDRQEWAIKTLGYLASGIDMGSIEQILHGISTLKSTEDGTSCRLADETDGSWIIEMEQHKIFQDSKFYEFAGKKVERGIVDTYAYSVVKRLRDAMRIPGYLMAADPREIMKLEDSRREMHHTIFKAAGFTAKDIRDWNAGDGSDDFCNFAIELAKFVDKETNWFQDSKDEEENKEVK